MSAVLEPIAARYAHWLNLPAEQTTTEANEDPSLVRAMPVVLRIEKGDPPGRTSLLEAAAAAAVAVCLDPRAEEGGEWHEPLLNWVSGNIRKVARRARGAHWVAVEQLHGVRVDVAGAAVMALLPCRVVDTPREVSRLQISGSDLPIDEPPCPASDLPALWLNPNIAMTVGKAAAQVGHATMILAALLDDVDVRAWRSHGYRCSVRTPTVNEWETALPYDDPEQSWRERGIVAVRDAGFTEVDPGTITVLAKW